MDSLRAGGIGAAVGAATGAVTQGSYIQGWQKVLHGNSYTDIGLAQGDFALQSGNLQQSLPKIEAYPLSYIRLYPLRLSDTMSYF